MTGVWKGSGTDANVVIVIHGSEAESQPIILNKNMITSRTVLARGNEDAFVIHLPMSLGEVQYIHVRHDNSGKNPSWYFSHATISDRQTEKIWTFLSNTWFALEKGDGKIDRLLFPISSQETKTFKYSLNSKGSKSFSEGHLWLSVVTKPPWSKFTRVQRATCCLSLLMSAMLANALFYRTDKVADPTIQIGPLKFSWRQIVVGIESALIVTPVNLLIMALFKNSSEKPSSKVRAGTKLDVMLPHYCVYIAWFLSFATVSVSATFTFFFSLQWGKEISNQWLSSMLVSFTEDLFVLQPIKIVLIIVLTACLFRKNDSKVVSHHLETEQQIPIESKEANDASRVEVEILNEDELNNAREYQVKEAKMYSFGRELVGYLLFLSLMTIVCYGNRSYHGYLMTKNIKDTFSNFSLVRIGFTLSSLIPQGLRTKMMRKKIFFSRN